jgi:hypothetical protein
MPALSENEYEKESTTISTMKTDAQSAKLRRWKPTCKE